MSVCGTGKSLSPGLTGPMAAEKYDKDGCAPILMVGHERDFCPIKVRRIELIVVCPTDV